MKIASISNTKNKLSLYLDLVRKGETIVITDRNRPIARLEPVSLVETDDEARLERLERNGVIIRSKRKANMRQLLNRALPELPGVDLLKILLEEREEGR